MAHRPRKLCAVPGCGRITDGRYCETHAAEAIERARQEDRRRGSAASRGYGHVWAKARKGFLARHPLCAEHMRLDPPEAVVATHVDHVVPHRGDKALFWDSANWQPLCAPCHAAKTAREDGGFGNPRAP